MSDETGTVLELTQDWLLVTVQRQTMSGLIHVPESSQGIEQMIVLAVGPGRYDYGEFIATRAQAGDAVIPEKGATMQLIQVSDVRKRNAELGVPTTGLIEGELALVRERQIAAFDRSSPDSRARVVGVERVGAAPPVPKLGMGARGEYVTSKAGNGEWTGQ